MRVGGPGNRHQDVAADRRADHRRDRLDAVLRFEADDASGDAAVRECLRPA